MEEENSLQLNLSNEVFKWTERPQKKSRQQRIKDTKKKKREQYKRSIEETVTTNKSAEVETNNASPKDDQKSPNIQLKKGTKVEYSGSKTGGNKFSSLFKNNPDIPHIDSVQVEQIKEKVFSKQTFTDLNDLHPFMVSNLKNKMGIDQMTSVQKQAIPSILTGQDVMVKSQTGSGKTLSYAIPIIQILQAQKPKVNRLDGPYCIVIVPTRELAIQSYETFRKLVNPYMWIVPGSIMGGESRKGEKARLRKGINILVSTPGRLLDHIENTASLYLERVRWIVIDEADRLLDMGFEKDVSKILTLLHEKSKEKQQTILLSATLSSGVERLAGMTLTDPIKVDVSHGGDTAQSEKSQNTEEEEYALPEKLKHHFVVVPSKLRLVTLTAFILWKCKFSPKIGKMIVFLSTQDAVDFHHMFLQNILCGGGEDDDDDDPEKESKGDEIDLFKLHGEMDQKGRTKTYNEFIEADSGVLFCTDVAARGLDLPHVSWIVQYNTPGSATDYIHRVGRTARIGSQGQALIFLTPAEVEYIKLLTKYKISLQEMPMDDILKTLLLQEKALTKKERKKAVIPHNIQEAATALQMKFETSIQNSQELREGARRAYQSFIRAYATYPADQKHIFNMKNLHLGHTAKSFALQDAPTSIGTMVGKNAHLYKGKRKDKKDFPRKRNRTEVSEFGSGLEPAGKRSRNATENGSGSVSGKRKSAKPKMKKRKGKKKPMKT